MVGPFQKPVVSVDRSQLVPADRQSTPQSVKHRLRKVVDDVRAIRSDLHLPSGSVIVLERMISFLQEKANSVTDAAHHSLTSTSIIVFPSNKALMKRTGQAASTMRRNVACLVSQGLIKRIDSPNCKRYPVKRGGKIVQAFGFDLAPLMGRADEFRRRVSEMEARADDLKCRRRDLTILRRHVLQIITNAQNCDSGMVGWKAFETSYHEIAARMPRTPNLDDIDALNKAFEELLTQVEAALATVSETLILSAQGAQNEHHIESINKTHNFDLKARARATSPDGHVATDLASSQSGKEQKIHFSRVVHAWPEIETYAGRQISSWNDFWYAADQMRRYAHIKDHVWYPAIEAVGRLDASIAAIFIATRGVEIPNPGGYFRHLMKQAVAGEFSATRLIDTQLKKRLSAQKESCSDPYIPTPGASSRMTCDAYPPVPDEFSIAQVNQIARNNLLARYYC